MKFINIIIAVAAGLIVLFGYFLPSPGLQSLRTPLLDWAVTLSGVAGLVAIINLVFGVHWRRVKDDSPGKNYSSVIILTFVLTVGAGIILGPSNATFQKTVTAIQVPIATSMMAVLAVTLAYSSIRMLQRQRNWMGFIFFLSVILFMILNSGILAYTTEIPVLKFFLSGLHQVPVAGARGILLGVALGSLATGIRVLIGSDRPYNG